MNRKIAITIVFVLILGLTVFTAYNCRRSKLRGGKPEPQERVAFTNGFGVRIAEETFNDVFFISPATLPKGASVPAGEPGLVGVAVGEANTIMRTADGGKTWAPVTKRNTEGPDFYGVTFKDALNGWAVSPKVLMHTQDGGLTWNPSPALPERFYYFGPFTATAQHYLQMQTPTCSATIYRVLDGGKIWEPLKASLPHNDYEAVFFLNDTLGWLASNYGRFAVTTDGGESWKEANIDNGGHLAQIQFVNASNGWLRPISGHNGAVWATADGGQTWARQNAGIRDYWGIQDMQFLDDKTGFLLIDLGSDGFKLLRTIDGGATWPEITSLKARLLSICFMDRNAGWACGADGWVYRFELP